MAVLRSPRPVVVVALVLLAACTSVEPQPIGASQAAIIRGTRETGLPSVVLVARTGLTTGSGGLCTGTVIGPYAVLTAKHCVFSESGSGYIAVPTAEFLVIVGSDLDDRASIVDTFGVVEMRTTAGSAIDADIENGDDLAVLLLTRNVGTPAYEIATAVPGSGDDVNVVGYGRTITGAPDPADSGTKYRATMRVSRSGSRLIETSGPAWTCQGDSGGPLFDGSMRVAGVTSFNLGATCTNSYSYFTAVPRHAALIGSALDYAPPCTPSTETCNGFDDDCNGVVDEGCLELGDPCAGDGECGNGLCRVLDGSRICTRDCDPRMAIPRCPFDFYCRENGCGTGECVAGNPGAFVDGETCASNLDCSSNRCTTVAGAQRCGRSCALTGESCPTGEVCDTTGGGAECGTCLPFSMSTAPRPFGALCETDAQCIDGDCAAPGGFCTRSCDAASPCGAGFHCRALECVRGDLGGAGTSCISAEDCSATAPECVDADGETLCALPCDAEGMCGGGFACAATDVGMRCIPAGEPLGAACTGPMDCRSSICAGLCTRVCDAATPCPEGFSCTPAGDVSGCFPPAAPAPRERGGCSVSRTHDARGTVAALFGALMIALGALRRRRRR